MDRRDLDLPGQAGTSRRQVLRAGAVAIGAATAWTAPTLSVLGLTPSSAASASGHVPPSPSPLPPTCTATANGDIVALRTSGALPPVDVSSASSQASGIGSNTGTGLPTSFTGSGFSASAITGTTTSTVTPITGGLAGAAESRIAAATTTTPASTVGTTVVPAITISAFQNVARADADPLAPAPTATAGPVTVTVGGSSFVVPGGTMQTVTIVPGVVLIINESSISDTTSGGVRTVTALVTTLRLQIAGVDALTVGRAFAQATSCKA